MRDERHDETEHDAQDRGRALAVLDVPRDEHQALDRQDRGRHPRAPGASEGQRTKGRDALAYLVEHEDLHDARRVEKERSEAFRTHNRMFILCLLQIAALTRPGRFCWRDPRSEPGSIDHGKYPYHCSNGACPLRHPNGLTNVKYPLSKEPGQLFFVLFRKFI
jgi:hypothetical protein